MLTRASTKGLVWLFVWSRGPWQQVAYLVISFIVGLFAVAELQGVPLSEDRTVIRLVWLSCVPGVIAAGLLAPCGTAEEVLPRRPVGVIRLGWVLGVTVLPILLQILGQGLSGELDPTTTLWFSRNHLFMLGMSLIASRYLIAAASWVPGCVYLLLCWFLGTSDNAGTPWWWAFPHYLPDLVAPWIFAGVVYGAGVWMQYLRPSAIER